MATTTVSPPVDTAHVSGRRKVRYQSHDEVLAECERFAADGYRQLGNWSLGQVSKHLAAAMTTALDGFPGRVAFPMRLAAQLLFKKKVIAGPMRPASSCRPSLPRRSYPTPRTTPKGSSAVRRYSPLEERAAATSTRLLRQAHARGMGQDYVQSLGHAHELHRAEVSGDQFTALSGGAIRRRHRASRRNNAAVRLNSDKTGVGDASAETVPIASRRWRSYARVSRPFIPGEASHYILRVSATRLASFTSRDCISPMIRFVIALLALASSTSMALADTLLVANSDRDQGGGNISAYTSDGTPVQVPLIPGLRWPDVMVTDGDGYLYVLDNGAGAVGKYTLSGQVVNAKLISGLVSPEALAIDQHGHLFVSNNIGFPYQISEYSTAGALINPAFIPNTSSPASIAIDNNTGNMYIAYPGSLPYGGDGAVVEYDSSGNVVNNQLITGLKFPEDVVLDGHGHLFLSEWVGNRVGEYNLDGTAVNAALVTGLNAPIGIAFDEQGNLLIANNAGGTVGKYSISGAPIDPTLITGLSYPTGLLMIPEPATVILAALGGLAFLAIRRHAPAR